jgi:hypothetical protein
MLHERNRVWIDYAQTFESLGLFCGEYDGLGLLLEVTFRWRRLTCGSRPYY